MLRFCSFLIGEDYNYTINFQPSGKRKVILLGTSMLIPVILWFITAFLTSLTTMNHNLFVALTVGVISALIIYLIERSIILSNGGWLIFVFRILLGFIIACLGAITLDLVIFKSDVDSKVVRYEKAHLVSLENDLESKYVKDINDKKAFFDISYKNWKKAERNYIYEMQGKKGNSSGMIGNGEIARQLKGLMISAQETFLNQKAELKELESTKDLKIEIELQEAKSKYNSDGLLIRIRALYDLVKEDSNLKIVYGLFTAFIFLLEFIVIIAKTGSKRSIDEEIELFRDNTSLLKLQQYKAMLNNNVKSFQYLPEIVKAKALLNDNTRN